MIIGLIKCRQVDFATEWFVTKQAAIDESNFKHIGHAVGRDFTVIIGMGMCNRERSAESVNHRIEYDTERVDVVKLYTGSDDTIGILDELVNNTIFRSFNIHLY